MSDTKTREDAREAAAGALTPQHVARMIREQGRVMILSMETDGWNEWPQGLYAIPAKLAEYVTWKLFGEWCRAATNKAHADRLSKGNEAYNAGLADARRWADAQAQAARALAIWAGEHGLPVEFVQI